MNNEQSAQHTVEVCEKCGYPIKTHYGQKVFEGCGVSESAAGSQVSAIVVGKMIWDAVANSHITNSRSCVQLGEEILAAVRSTPKEKKEEWISVETNPEHDTRCMVFLENGNLMVLDFHNGFFGEYDEDDGEFVISQYTDSVTHWMPLPAPPQQGSQDKKEGV